MSVLSELRDLRKEANEIFESTLPWETKYHLIFSERISRRVFSLLHLEYYDPDTTYEEDVTAFMNAFNHATKED